jgi:hypothetical protein
MGRMVCFPSNMLELELKKGIESRPVNINELSPRGPTRLTLLKSLDNVQGITLENHL